MQTSTTQPKSVPHLCSIKNAAKYLAELDMTEGALRALIARAKDIKDGKGRVIKKGNGLLESGAIIRVGRRLFVDIPALFEWFKSRGQNHE